jgi:hypothetical protein
VKGVAMLKSFQRHLYSTAGDVGLAALADRARTWLALLEEAWRARNETDGFCKLFKVLVDAITALDRVDLRTPQIQLRPTTAGEVPLSVTCKLARALVDSLAAGDIIAERNAMEALAAAGLACGRVDFELGFRSALAELLIEAGEYNRAVATIDANLPVQSSFPYSQYLLYLALRKQKQAGLIAGSPRICLDDLSDRFCERPFTTILTISSSMKPSKRGHAEPALHACDCAGMLPYPLNGSRLDDAGGIGDVWNGPEAQEIRRSILEGDYTYCAPLVCPYLVKGSLPRRDDIVLIQSELDSPAAA